ncbi:MAG TPA: cupredoxin domain-containing protein [Gemmatimonadales bacterium]|nr:cupredoxin domain-containing protein [Gemmatimonadales bacterium]
MGLFAGCTRTQEPATGRYTPRAREFTITTVPLLVHEARGLYPFLKQDFGPGGILEGKEVYAFSPSTLTAVEGDTLHFTFINPEDDDHAFFLHDCEDTTADAFVLPDCEVKIPGQSTRMATHIARRAGVYTFSCSVAKHLGMMWGQLVVLAPAAVLGRSSQLDAHPAP